MTAWQPSRELVVRSHAVSRRSASASDISLRFSIPLRTIRWQVVQAQLPPQACSRWTPLFIARSRNDSGRPWPSKGSFPCSNSTTVSLPSLMKVTLGIAPSCPPKLRRRRTQSLDVVDALAGERLAHAVVHHHFRQMTGGVVQRVRRVVNQLPVGARHGRLCLGERHFDGGDFGGRDLAAR